MAVQVTIRCPPEGSRTGFVAVPTMLSPSLEIETSIARVHSLWFCTMAATRTVSPAIRLLGTRGRTAMSWPSAASGEERQSLPVSAAAAPIAARAALAARKEPWNRYLKPKLLVPIMAESILDGWDTPPEERRKVIKVLLAIAKGETGAGDQTKVSAARTLIDVSVHKAKLEQAERQKSAEKDAGPTHPLVSVLRAIRSR